MAERYCSVWREVEVLGLQDFLGGLLVFRDSATANPCFAKAGKSRMSYNQETKYIIMIIIIDDVKTYTSTSLTTTRNTYISRNFGVNSTVLNPYKYHR